MTISDPAGSFESESFSASVNVSEQMSGGLDTQAINNFLHVSRCTSIHNVSIFSVEREPREPLEPREPQDPRKLTEPREARKPREPREPREPQESEN